MNRKLARLAKQREYLVAQAAVQRLDLAQNMEPWRAPLALADQGIAVLGYFRRHPALWSGAALLITFLRPQRTGRWLRRGWLAWRFARGFFR